ncbi:hypothetical protein [Streptomyces sp. NPDC013455]|uniref:hypothetical protein n=1 Tax=Streptomyces sp. NPDC013455 TaxID=3155605 RepID=UPI0033E05E02
MRDHAQPAEPEPGLRRATPAFPAPARGLPYPWPGRAGGDRHDEDGGGTPAGEQRAEPAAGAAGTEAGAAGTEAEAAGAAHVTVLSAERGIINTGTVHGGQSLVHVDASGRPAREAGRGL